MTALRILRTARGWTIEELAERAQVNEKTIRLLEAGTRDPKPRTVARLARALRVSNEAVTDGRLAQRILRQAKDCPEEPPSDEAARRYAERLERIEAEEAKP